MADRYGGNLQELTRKLQEERDTLRQEVETITRTLSAERTAKNALENELQVKELELLHVQQRGNQVTQQLRDKLQQITNELEEEKALHKMAVMGKNTAIQRNTALGEEMKQLEVKWRKEVEKKELVMAELEILKEDARVLALDRDQLIQRTEADAKRVRELWQRIAHEHEVQLEALKAELVTTQQDSADRDRAVVEFQAKATELEAAAQMQMQEKAALEAKLASMTNDQTLFQERLELERSKERQQGDANQKWEVQIQTLKNECQMAVQREEMAVRERKMAQKALEKCQTALDDKNEELLILKTEFSDLLDKYEHMTEEYKQEARQKDVQAKLWSKKLAEGKQCAKELAKLRKREIQEYKKVLHAVNRKLTQVQEANDNAELNAWSLASGKDSSPSQNSLCIYRH